LKILAGDNWGVELDGQTGRGHRIQGHGELVYKPARCGPEGSTQPGYPPRARQQSGPAQACHNSEFRHLCFSTAVMAEVFVLF